MVCGGGEGGAPGEVHDRKPWKALGGGARAEAAHRFAKRPTRMLRRTVETRRLSLSPAQSLNAYLGNAIRQWALHAYDWAGDGTEIRCPPVCVPSSNLHLCSVDVAHGAAPDGLNGLRRAKVPMVLTRSGSGWPHNLSATRAWRSQVKSGQAAVEVLPLRRRRCVRVPAAAYRAPLLRLSFSLGLATGAYGKQVPTRGRAAHEVKPDRLATSQI